MAQRVAVILNHWAILILLIAPGGIFAQTNNGKPQSPANQQSNNSAAQSHSKDAAEAPVPSEGVEILTDTMGVDFRPYLTTLVKTLKQNWYTRMPQSVYPPLSKRGKVAIKFAVQKDGSIGNLSVDQSSGDWVLDNASLGAVKVSEFDPLPAQFHGPQLELRIYFYYNSQPPQITISPSADVRVAVGATQQFSASGKDITNSSVKWSLDGKSCSNSGCGTISEDGLYTAPAEVPDPPTVTVQAVSRRDEKYAGATRLTIVAPPSK